MNRAAQEQPDDERTALQRELEEVDLDALTEAVMRLMRRDLELARERLWGGAGQRGTGGNRL